MTDLTDQQVEALDAAATPGPWRARTSMKLYNHTQADAEFIEAARTLVLSLLARAQAAEAERDALRAENERLDDENLRLVGARGYDAEDMERLTAERDDLLHKWTHRDRCTALAARLASMEAERDALAAKLRAVEAPPLDRLFDAIYDAMYGDLSVGAEEREAVAQIAESVHAALSADTTPEATEGGN